jgi:hypothetical protein
VLHSSCLRVELCKASHRQKLQCALGRATITIRWCRLYTPTCCKMASQSALPHMAQAAPRQQGTVHKEFVGVKAATSTFVSSSDISSHSTMPIAAVLMSSKCALSGRRFKGSCGVHAGGRPGPTEAAALRRPDLSQNGDRV